MFQEKIQPDFLPQQLELKTEKQSGTDEYISERWI